MLTQVSESSTGKKEKKTDKKQFAKGEKQPGQPMQIEFGLDDQRPMQGPNGEKPLL